MRSITVWAALALLLLLVLLDGAASSASSPYGTATGTASSSAAAWQRALFGRNSRNLLQRNKMPPASDVGGTFDMVMASSLNNAGYNNEYGQLFTPYAMEQQSEQQEQPEQEQQGQQQQQLNQQQLPLSSALRRQQTEVYGIVEPLIEDTPCANRACILNDDCCPTGVCVNTYGEGKCVYVFGHQRDLCQGHADCPRGSECMLAPQEGIWRCEAGAPLLQDVYNLRPKQTLGSECSSSTDCPIINGMCCQRQRLHHRGAFKLSCGYFRDAFDCVDVAQEHFASLFQHRRT